MHIHILGICGTFMASLAMLAKELNFKVTGSDQNIYPPMSTALIREGIEIIEGYDVEQLALSPDCFIVGNVMCRGMPIIEALLERKLPFVSGPEWLRQYVLSKRHVLAVSGTHGKTTTTSMLAWILECAGLKPGFLIGGIPNNFGISARLGAEDYFVIEADEYDTAFFDKRSKFIHYWPRTLVINNIEFDHADIFKDLQAIQQQFHHLVRLVPKSGLIIYPNEDKNIQEVLEKGCWSSKETLEPSAWNIRKASPDYSCFEVNFAGTCYGTIEWSLLGYHNVLNALAAIAAAKHVGVDPNIAVQALCQFQNVKRRLEIKGIKNGITVYDDFAHHPTAIRTTLEGLRAKVGKDARIISVVDIRSNTMRGGYHQEALVDALKEANQVYFYRSDIVSWDVDKLFRSTQKSGGVFNKIPSLLSDLIGKVKENDRIIFMSNGGFDNIQDEFIKLI